MKHMIKWFYFEIFQNYYSCPTNQTVTIQPANDITHFGQGRHSFKMCH